MSNHLKENSRTKFFLILGVVSLAVFMIIFISINPALFALLRGPRSIVDINGENTSAYVSTEVDMIVDFYAEKYDEKTGKVSSVYAVIPRKGGFITIELPARYSGAAETVKNETRKYILGGNTLMNKYFVVTGTIDYLYDDEATMLYEWFQNNSQWMQSSGFINSVTDLSLILSSKVLRVDYVVNTREIMIYPLVIVMVVFGALFLFSLVCIVRGKDTSRKREREPKT